MDLLQQFLVGSVAGMSGGIVSHPIDTIKVRMQLYGSKDGFGVGSSHVAGNPNRPGMLLTARGILKGEGIVGLYRGLTASLLRQATFIGTKFFVYEQVKTILLNSNARSSNGNLNFLTKFGSGAVAGMCGAVVGCPADVAMVRMQADGRLPEQLRRNYKNGLDAMLRVSREEGVMVLFRGLQPTVARATVITASQFAVYDQSKESLKPVLGSGSVNHIFSSALASVVAGLTSNPFDVAKSRLQNMKVRKKDGKYPFTGTFDCLYKTVKNEGPFAVYKGLSPTIVRQLPLNVTRFLVFEQLMGLLKRRRENF